MEYKVKVELIVSDDDSEEAIEKVLVKCIEEGSNDLAKTYVAILKAREADKQREAEFIKFCNTPCYKYQQD